MFSFLKPPNNQNLQFWLGDRVFSGTSLMSDVQQSLWPGAAPCRAPLGYVCLGEFHSRMESRGGLWGLKGQREAEESWTKWEWASPLSQSCSSRVGLATLWGRVSMVLHFHLLLFCLKVKASPKTGLNLDFIQSAFSCSEQGSALVCCIMDNTPGDKRGLLQ